MVVKRKKDTREDVPQDILDKAYRTGVVQQDREGRWRIVSRQKKKYWTPKYESKEKAQNALKAYQASKH